MPPRRPVPGRSPCTPRSNSNPYSAREHTPGAHSGTITSGASTTEAHQSAAAYVRMSTDHQEYSTANQLDAIHRYAGANDLRVVQVYTDEGRSGLTLQGREGLRQLLEDVLGGHAPYRTVLVYDVSRWGRFQDVDEAAHYEFLCRRAGMRVEYCTEPFRNDGSTVSAVVKAVKRVMAGEYSRELSQKVFEGKCRLIKEGFRQGASAGYGFRRMVVDAEGNPRMIIEHGEHKYLQTDRITLVPGPTHEVRVVRWIFEQIADHARRPHELVRILNGRGVPCEGGRAWNADRVTSMISNTKYIGHLVFNKSSSKLRTKLIWNHPDQWVRCEAAFVPIVTPSLFARAQRATVLWSTRISDRDALRLLRATYLKHGTISTKLIDDTAGMPGSAFYRYRFGSMARAYARVGFRVRKDYRFLQGHTERYRAVVALRRRMVESLERRGIVVEWESNTTLRLNHRQRVTILSGRWSPTMKGQYYKTQVKTRPFPEWVLIVRFEPEGHVVRDYWLCSYPRTEIGIERKPRRYHKRHQAKNFESLLTVLAAAAGPDLGLPGRRAATRHVVV